MQWKKQTSLFVIYETILQKKYEALCSQKLFHWRKIVALRHKSRNFQVKKMQENAVRKWGEKLENKRDFPLRNKFKIADEFYNAKIITRIFSKWFQIRLHTESFQQLMEKANEIYQAKCEKLLNYFFKFFKKVFV